MRAAVNDVIVEDLMSRAVALAINAISAQRAAEQTHLASQAGENRAALAGWAKHLGRPGPEDARSQRTARLGGLTALFAMVMYLTWRVAFTLPSGPAAIGAWVLVIIEAVPVLGLVMRIVTLWNIDSSAPAPVRSLPPGRRVAVLIPTYNEPAEVIAPTIAAACALEPVHETWVLDDGDRPWVAQLCAEYGARYVCRPVHDHAKAGNINHALAVMEKEEAQGAEPFEILAVLDCDHVPLPHFLTATLGWFDDPEVALVQAPQNFFNTTAFDHHRTNGEQDLFFNVLMASRNRRDAGPFWCGSTSLIRARALREVGGVATDTIIEDMHTTLRLLRRGWRTAFHHQTLALGLAPDTADQYLLQRRRWGMGAMQVLLTERLWRAKSWLSWRNYYEYLSGTTWWLEGAATIAMLCVPMVLMITGTQTSTANPTVFAAMFATCFAVRLWGIKRLFRHQISWLSALSLRVLRVPIGLSCAWWLLTRRALSFQVTPKHGSAERMRSDVPAVLVGMAGVLTAVLAYAAAGVAGLVPWHATASSTMASGAWLAVATAALVVGTLRVRSDRFASSRRNAHRFAVSAPVRVDGCSAELVDISANGVTVRVPGHHYIGTDPVVLALPGANPIRMLPVRTAQDVWSFRRTTLTVAPNDWAALRTLSLWMFHTPQGVLDDLPPMLPAVASTGSTPPLPETVATRPAVQLHPLPVVAHARV
jgi:cellulose synthase (UDP-forming)